jgi:cupin fold WbuC family metalloprotein
VKRITLIDAALLEQVSRLAVASPRLRKNHNFHASEAERCGRLLNAVEPGSYVRPHCHIDASMDESILVVHGRVGVLEFDAAGKVTGKAVLEPDGEAIGINVPHGTFHSLVALLPGTVFFEAKAGPYAPLSEQEKAAWAPAEGSAEAARYLEWMRGQFE